MYTYIKLSGVESTAGFEMYDMLKMLFPISRSITGNGVRETLNIIQTYLPNLKISEVESGKKVLDWEVPKEWNCYDGYIITPKGDKICSFKKNNLHIVSYSLPINKKITLKDLQDHLHSIPELPDAIPYITSYYDSNWGFCIEHDKRMSLEDGIYQVYIDSNLEVGYLTYGECFIPSTESKFAKEIILTTNICHPSMGNNELSGPVVLTFLGNCLAQLKKRNYSYRLLFIPETIGSIVYINDNLKQLKENCLAGMSVICVGDDNNYSYLRSKYANCILDRCAKVALKDFNVKFNEYSFLERGSDERQFSSVGVDIPFISLMRSKYNTYKEYHTSKDDLTFVSPAGLMGGLLINFACLEILESNVIPKAKIKGEPFLRKRDLVSTYSSLEIMRKNQTKIIRNILMYSDGSNDLIDLSIILGESFQTIKETVDLLITHDLISIDYAKQ